MLRFQNSITDSLHRALLLSADEGPAFWGWVYVGFAQTKARSFFPQSRVASAGLMGVRRVYPDQDSLPSWRYPACRDLDEAKQIKAECAEKYPHFRDIEAKKWFSEATLRYGHIASMPSGRKGVKKWVVYCPEGWSPGLALAPDRATMRRTRTHSHSKFYF